MKRKALKALLTVCIAVLATFVSKAQISTSYSVSNLTNGSLLTDMNGNAIDLSSQVNIINGGVTNTNSTLQSIGFSFYFMGRYFSHFIAGNNGQLALGLAASPTAMLLGTAANDLTRPVVYPSTGADNAPVLAPFWDDLATPSTSFTVRKLLTGTAPNRCCVIEWNAKINTSSTNDNTPADGQFQVRLYEGTGAIEYVYGKMTIGPSSGTVSASIGFTAGNSDNSFLALQDLSTFNFTAIATQEAATQNLVGSATPGNITALHSTDNGSRRVFRFTPPLLSGTTPASLQIGGIGATTMSLSWPDTYSNENGYAVFISTDNTNFTFHGWTGPNVNNYTAYNLNLGTTYYWQVQAFTEGAAGSVITGSGTTACALNGTYSVGPGGHFSNLTRAIDSLRIKGITGNVVFELNAGFTGSGESFPISLPKTAQLPCYAPGRILSIRPAAGAVNLQLTGNEANGLILLDSCDYLVLDGRPGGTGSTSQLSFLNNAYGPVFRLSNASNNKIRYVNCSGIPGGGGAFDGLVHLSGGAQGCDKNLFESCSFYSANPAIPLFNLFYGSRFNTATHDNDTLLNCSFYNYKTSAIHLEPGVNGLVLQGNSFYNTSMVETASEHSAIKIKDQFNTQPHKINGNFFGGTAPQCGGGHMQIDHRVMVSLVDVLGAAEITNNVFRRLIFDNQTFYTSDPVMHLIRAGGLNLNFSGNISNNVFGGAGLADSIFIRHNFSGSRLLFSCIYTESANNPVTIQNNSISNLRAYSPNTFTTLHLVSSFGTSCRIIQNRIGDAAMLNSIVNNTNANTIAIHANNPGEHKVMNNLITRITNTSTGSDAVLQGISMNTGSVDSIANNEISHLSNRIGVNSWVMPLGGIFSAPAFTGGALNVITGNHIYGLHNASSGNSGPLKGIHITNSGVASRNLIHSLNSSTTFNISIYGIYANDAANMENNMIRLGIDTTGNTITRPYGFIGIYGGSIIRHNSISITGTNIAAGILGTNCYFSPNTSLVPLVKNNIFSNTRSNLTTGSAKHRCISLGTSNISQSSNYNLFQTTGTDGIIGSFNSNNQITLANWQTASGLDANSIIGDPKFVNTQGNSNTLNLHISTGSAAEGAGTSGLTIPDDYDGELRSGLSPVDIGADAGNYAFPTGINPVTAGSLGIRYYPNPARDHIFLDQLLISDQWQELVVTGADGRDQLLTRNIRNLRSLNLDLRHLPGGMYIIRLLRKNGRTAYLKVVKL